MFHKKRMADWLRDESACMSATRDQNMEIRIQMSDLHYKKEYIWHRVISKYSASRKKKTDEKKKNR